MLDGIDLPFHPDLAVPALREVRLAIPNPDPVADVADAARRAVESTFASSVTPGMTVAVGGGSRGLTNGWICYAERSPDFVHSVPSHSLFPPWEATAVEQPMGK